MTVLTKFKIAGATVSINETPGEIEIEVTGSKSPKQTTAIEDYLFDEGIMDEIFLGNLKFHEKNVEELFLPQTPQE